MELLIPIQRLCSEAVTLSSTAVTLNVEIRLFFFHLTNCTYIEQHLTFYCSASWSHKIFLHFFMSLFLPTLITQYRQQTLSVHHSPPLGGYIYDHIEQQGSQVKLH